MSNEVAERRTEIEFQPATLKLTNKAQLVDWATEIRDKFKKENLISTPESLAGDKSVLSDLKGKYKELDEARLEVQREFKKPLDSFNGDVKEALKIINEAITPIDTVIKNEELREKEERRNNVLEIAKQIFSEYDVDLSKLEFNEKWANKTYGIGKRKDEITEQAVRLAKEKETLIKNSEAIQKLALDRKLEPEGFVQQLYNGVSMASVIENINRAEKDMKDRIERNKRLEVARKAQEKVQREAKTTKVGDKRIDNETGEVVEEFKTFRFTAKLSIAQAKQLKRFFDEHEIDFSAEVVS
ncbi:DUF1351 domain-containing protein [Pediococcus stilesii]|uniref:DUF1351 domain-containing protein n=1 Tax=Pediococcus stilesii TaxID=331679 RepID=A0A5R9BZJ7_9LACO|nr:DUF1351 domain-containing protein [Pediococcus stilesii]TLQ05442.1 DUF1351 domain-containing protein [Pediococcus stilesii]